MIKINLAATLGALNDVSKLMLEESAAYAISCGESEVLPAHLLLKSLENPFSDVRFILNKLNISHEELTALLLSKTQTSHTNIDSVPSFSPLLIEMLQEAWLLGSLEFEQTQIRSASIFLALVLNASRYLPTAVASYLNQINKETLRQSLLVFAKGSAESQTTQENTATPSAVHTDQSDLARFAENLTAKASAGNIDPVLARDKEIDLMIDILSRRRKNNPIVVGDAGVGKSALIEGLALRIVSENVPESMLNTELMNLDLGALQAGAAVKGEFEKRFKGIMKEVNESIKPIILFIDEAHTLIGAGNQSGGLDVSNLLKPALARGELKTIAATTWSEYKKYFEKDAALSRRFQLVKLESPSVNDAIVIMRGLRATYEEAHKVLIEEDALISVVELSERYLSGRQLPDKAIDVLDTACARVSINLTSPPKLISELSNNRHKIEMEIALLDRELLLGLSQNKDRLSELKKELKKIDKTEAKLRKDWLKQQEIVRQIIELRHSLLEKGSSNSEINKEDKNNSLSSEENKQIAKLTSLSRELEKLQKTQVLVSPHVTQKQIATVIAEWTGVPLDKLSQNELNVITELPSYLTKEIKGQELAIKHLHKHLLTARADLRRTGRPLGAFLLVGPSGVGKTETVIQIADLLFGGKQYLTTINMSEFQEKHTVSRLIGSPPGYVGYGEGGVLTEAIRRKPYSVVLLDEVEKAHPDVLNLFYQAFDKGELADGEGRIIDCKNIVFFLTSNLGYQTIVDNADAPEKINDELYPELSEFFKPALLARMEVIPYLPLPREVLKIIIDGKLAKLSNLLERRFEAKIIIDEQVKEEILNRATRAENGARILESIIDGQMLPPVSLLLLQKMSQNEEVKKIQFMIKDNKFVAKVGENECDLA